MDDNKVYICERPDEWYQEFYICGKCGCNFMTIFYLGNIGSSKNPRNYCPNCGVKFNVEVNE